MNFPRKTEDACRNCPLSDPEVRHIAQTYLDEEPRIVEQTAMLLRQGLSLSEIGGVESFGQISEAQDAIKICASYIVGKMCFLNVPNPLRVE